MKVLLIVAMSSELNGFLDKLEYENKIVSGICVYYSKYNNVDLFIAKSDVGKVNAAMLTTTLILKLKPKYVINAGIAGGLTPNMKLLDVVASKKITYHDFDLTPFGYQMGQINENELYLKGSNKLLSLLDDSVYKGLIVSGDQFIEGMEKTSRIKKYFPKALACDMEGASIAHVAHYMSKSFLVIRAISDNVYLEDQLAAYNDLKYEAIEKVVKVTLDLLAKL